MLKSLIALIPTPVWFRTGLFGLLLVCVGWSGPVLAQQLVFVGHAYAIDSERLLYVETHRVELDSQQQYRRAEVSYQDAEGEVIAVKQLDYLPYVLRPQLEFEDKRDRYKLRVMNREDSISLETLEANNQQQDSVALPSGEMVIVDAGFDRMVRKHWDALLAGENIEFEFLALSRSSLVSFEVYQTGLNEESLSLAIAPTNWLIQLLMDPIELRYDRNSKRLMEYRGVTNIRAWEKGSLSEDNYHAHIRYEYLPLGALPAPGFAHQTVQKPVGDSL